jgi:TnpA family transposase
LPIFRHYDIDGVLHSSSDGQKFETRIDTINSRHSPKYFGLKKGVVSYSMVANHVPVNATIIGANEHESHYVFDLIANNTTDIGVDVHSTDSHGANQVNSAILYQFGSRFAPRYARVRDKVNRSLCGFRPLSSYRGLIKPVNRVRKKLIISEWPNVERIFVSLAQKTTTQSIITGKLSSHARKSRTKKALWAYDNIIESIYLLSYIDSPSLRRNVQRALNRCESYHKLRRAISFAGFGKLRFKTEREQQIWGECARLVANCVVYLNASILSNLLVQNERAGAIEEVERLKRISPVAWQHINFHGRYLFSTGAKPLNMDTIIRPFLADGTR